MKENQEKIAVYSTLLGSELALIQCVTVSIDILLLRISIESVIPVIYRVYNTALHSSQESLTFLFQRKKYIFTRTSKCQDSFLSLFWNTISKLHILFNSFLRDWHCSWNLSVLFFVVGNLLSRVAAFRAMIKLLCLKMACCNFWNFDSVLA